MYALFRCSVFGGLMLALTATNALFRCPYAFTPARPLYFLFKTIYHENQRDSVWRYRVYYHRHMVVV